MLMRGGKRVEGRKGVTHNGGSSTAISGGHPEGH